MDLVFSALSARLGTLFGDRKVVLAAGPRLAQRVNELRHLGARRSLVLVTEDNPPLHDPDQASWLALGSGNGLVAREHNRITRLLRTPPRWLRDHLDAYDPEGDALVIGTPYVTVAELAGRPVLNHRRPAWVELENKTTIDAFWAALGVQHAPAVVCAVDADDLWQASRLLDRGSGVVWSGDGPGINGGANYVRRVRGAEDAASAFEALSRRCTQIRVMPFLEGVPVSVHGMVFPDGTAVFRPMEMVVPRRAGTARFLYAGCASYYDPPAAIRDRMRAECRRVGEELRERVGYRGTFTLDGIATAEGFLPTEINTRYGGAMSCLEDALPELPLALVQVALVAGHDLGIGYAQFEELLLPAADNRRSGAIAANVKVPVPETLTGNVVFGGGRCQWAQDYEMPHGTLRLRPGPLGGRIELELDPETRGPAGSLFVSALALADLDWGTGFGPLEAPVPVAEHFAAEAVEVA